MEQTLVVMESLAGKFGPQVKDVAGKFYSFGKFYKGDTAFPSGSVLKVDLYVTDKGNGYINRVLEVKGAEAVAPRPETKARKATTKGTSESMSKSDWAAKDRSQLIGGLSHDSAAITAALVVVNTNLVPLEVYRELLEGMLKIREELK